MDGRKVRLLSGIPEILPLSLQIMPVIGSKEFYPVLESYGTMLLRNLLIGDVSIPLCIQNGRANSAVDSGLSPAACSWTYGEAGRFLLASMSFRPGTIVILGLGIGASWPEETTS